MANIKSAIKRNRQSLIHRARNKSAVSSLRTSVKKLRSAVEEQDKEQAQTLLKETVRLLDVSASKGIIHRNKAARSKSRLTRLVSSL
jgi:small subunit ribosomal protein S20